MNHIKGVLLIIVLCLSVLSGCIIPKHLEFSGESENWRVTFEADVVRKKIKENSQTTRNSETNRYTIEYIGNGPIPERIEYSVARYGGSTSFSEHGILKGTGSSCRNCSITWEDSEIEATINWDGQSETMLLKLK